MKIAFANKQLPSDAPNGVSVQVHILANELQKLGHSVTCYSFSDKPPDSLYEHVKLLWGTDSRVKRKFVPAMKFRAIRPQDYDIVHYHGDDYLCKGALNRVRTFYGSAIREAAGAKKMSRFFYQTLFYAFELISSRKKGTLVGISNDTLQCIPFVKYQIPCGVPLERFHEGRQKTPNPSILFVGDLESRKRGNLLLSIFKNEVLSEYPECILTVVGSQFCSGPNVRYCGNIPVESLVEEYQKSWICCIPSSYEGFGVPAIEAMGCGTVVVAAHSAGIDEIVTDGVNGLLCTPKMLGKTLVRALSDQNLRRTLVHGGILRSREFDISLVAAKYELLYEKVKKLNIGAEKYS